MSCRYLILGHGYTASFLKPLLEERFGSQQVISTSRQDPKHLHFDLADPATWKNLPRAENCVWTFPAEPLEQVQAFATEHLHQWRRLVTLGSTGALQVNTRHQVVTEKTPLDMEMSRVAGEEFLRQQGGMTLLSAGIYGPGRDPREWVQKGWVGRSEKYVNMVHVKDLCGFIIASLEKGKPRSLYIASDNQPQTWQEVIDFWEEKKWVQDVAEKESSRPSKCVDNSWSLSQLGVELNYPDFKDLDF